ncbi:YqaA family protein [Poriferisphaera sp. WC338]|uniref:YqaA family protein n=1 Tax=Poriferisphaera sp. WC338 TaxID=3425129 RepID=UPI003D81A550
MNQPDQNQPTEQERLAAEAPAGPISKWAIHRRMYDWVLSFAHSKHSTTALFTISFAESSFFPIPPDVLLGPLCLGKRSKSLYFATVCTLASVLGAFFGYLLGYIAIEAAVAYIPGIHMGPEASESWKDVNGLRNAFDAYGQWFVFVAALTPIPFKLLTLTAGAAKMNLLVFFIACLIGRAIRFYGVAIVFWAIGPKAVPFIDKYFNLLCVIFVVLLIGGFALIKLF